MNINKKSKLKQLYCLLPTAGDEPLTTPGAYALSSWAYTKTHENQRTSMNINEKS